MYNVIRGGNGSQDEIRILKKKLAVMEGLLEEKTKECESYRLQLSSLRESKQFPLTEATGLQLMAILQNKGTFSFCIHINEIVNNLTNITSFN